MDIIAIAGSNTVLAVIITYLYAKWKIGTEVKSIRKYIGSLDDKIEMILKEIKEMRKIVSTNSSNIQQLSGKMEMVEQLVLKFVNNRK